MMDEIIVESEHSHQVVTHLYHVKIPYHLTPQEVEFEPPNALGKLPFTNLHDLLDDYDEEETRIILRSAVLLLEKYPHRSLSDALYTAMVWQRG